MNFALSQGAVNLRLPASQLRSTVLYVSNVFSAWPHLQQRRTSTREVRFERKALLAILSRDVDTEGSHAVRWMAMESRGRATRGRTQNVGVAKS